LAAILDIDVGLRHNFLTVSSLPMSLSCFATLPQYPVWWHGEVCKLSNGIAQRPSCKRIFYTIILGSHNSSSVRSRVMQVTFKFNLQAKENMLKDKSNSIRFTFLCCASLGFFRVLLLQTRVLEMFLTNIIKICLSLFKVRSIICWGCFSGFLFILTHISLDLLSLGSAEAYIRWNENWMSFNGKLCQEYSYQKLLKSVNWFSSYSRKCPGCFLRQSVQGGSKNGTVFLYTS